MPFSTHSGFSTHSLPQAAGRSVHAAATPRQARLVRPSNRAVVPSLSTMPMLHTLPTGGELLGGAVLGAGLGALLGLAVWVALLVVFAGVSALFGGVIVAAFSIAGGFSGFGQVESADDERS